MSNGRCRIHGGIAIAKRSTMRKAKIALARRLAIITHAMLRHGTEFSPA
jgi:transposase